MPGDKGKTTGGGRGTERGGGDGGEHHYETVRRSETLTEVVRRPGPAPQKETTPAEPSGNPNEPNRTN
jgi:hypothetical protein